MRDVRERTDRYLNCKRNDTLPYPVKPHSTISDPFRKSRRKKAGKRGCRAENESLSFLSDGRITASVLISNVFCEIDIFTNVHCHFYRNIIIIIKLSSHANNERGTFTTGMFTIRVRSCPSSTIMVSGGQMFVDIAFSIRHNAISMRWRLWDVGGWNEGWLFPHYTPFSCVHRSGSCP